MVRGRGRGRGRVGVEVGVGEPPAVPVGQAALRVLGEPPLVRHLELRLVKVRLRVRVRPLGLGLVGCAGCGVAVHACGRGMRVPGCAWRVGWGSAWRVRVCTPRLHQPRQRVHVAGHRGPPMCEAQIGRLDLAWRVRRDPTRDEPYRAAQSSPEPSRAGALPRPPFGHAASPSWIERRTSRRGSSPFAAACSALRPGVSRWRRPCFVEPLSSMPSVERGSLRSSGSYTGWGPVVSERRPVQDSFQDAAGGL